MNGDSVNAHPCPVGIGPIGVGDVDLQIGCVSGDGVARGNTEHGPRKRYSGDHSKSVRIQGLSDPLG
jgi:hypothetical protein